MLVARLHFLTTSTPGSTTVDVLADDTNGQTVTCSFDVVVQDNEDPVITCPTPNTHLMILMLVNVMLLYLLLLQQLITVMRLPTIILQYCWKSDYIPLRLLATGSTTVDVLADDTNGQAVTCSFDVVVQDNEDPVISNCPTDITVSNDNGQCDADVSWVVPTLVQTIVLKH